VALGILVVTRGDCRQAVLAATNYGRDSDSIATMAGALAGALGGLSSVPETWRQQVTTESQLELEEPALALAAVAREIHASDVARGRARAAAFEVLTGEGRRAAHLDPA
jgi:hypothetical protein